MHLTIIHRHRQDREKDILLKLAACSTPLGNVTSGWLRTHYPAEGKSFVMAVPADWLDTPHSSDLAGYDDCVHLPAGSLDGRRSNWLVISNGRFVTDVDWQWLRAAVYNCRADVVAVTVTDGLRRCNEWLVMNSRDDLIGFRLLYGDMVQPAPVPADWPHHLFLRSAILPTVLTGGDVPLDFGVLIERCRSQSLVVLGVKAGGRVLDLGSEEGLLAFAGMAVGARGRTGTRPHRVVVADGDKVAGVVLFGRGVSISKGAIIVGPVVIGDNVQIGAGAAVKASIIAPGVFVPAESLVEDRVVADSRPHSMNSHCRVRAALNSHSARQPAGDSFRRWPRFSYARCFKRLADIVASVIVLALFAPVVPVIALVIKLTSRGPVFFKDVRQGLYGKPFKCIKFRTMPVGAAGMQERLRVVNEADGPQFMMEDDPRVGGVGRFLRDTHIDEIPQFLNVLLGQMSVVGPRPSPEAENVLCPFWRDARLSVRPGITGLWQVCRTREPMKDFQEWIHYDVRYIRDLSFKLDLWICLRTAVRMAGKFIDQFQVSLLDRTEK